MDVPETGAPDAGCDRELHARLIVPIDTTGNIPPVAGVGPGLRILHSIAGRKFGLKIYKALVLSLTFLAYASYNAARRPISVVKPILHHPQKSESGGCGKTASSANGIEYIEPEWKPFGGKQGQIRLGNVDLAFLSAYAVGNFVSGSIADQVDPRHFLLVGMLGTGAASTLVSFGYFGDIHNTWFYVIGQTVSGLFQGTGWPIVVAIVAHWFGKGKRGLMMGLWNAHAPLGSVLGLQMSASVLTYGWGWSFVVVGLFTCAAGVFSWLFLVVQPADVGLVEPSTEAVDQKDGKGAVQDSTQAPLLPRSNAATGQPKNIGFFRAWCIPGVLQFSLSIFCSKLVVYTFLFWLPFYLSSICIDGKGFSVEDATTLSTVFDLASVVGSFLTGYLSDLTQSSASIAMFFAFLSIPLLYMYQLVGNTSLGINIVLLTLTSISVNGPYALITSVVAADLGSHQSLQGNQRALSTVTAIIGGMGSVGAALGPTLTGVLLSGAGEGDFGRVFAMLAGCSFAAGAMLFGLVWKEIKVAWGKRKKHASQAGNFE
ncbi:hypothetical protein BSKO_00344 [Bryopsis sp. KO-2023]|nr:hypothetical protein BSKO_00344 [Bryopsis sp. KO-2023]